MTSNWLQFLLLNLLHLTAQFPINETRTCITKLLILIDTIKLLTRQAMYITMRGVRATIVQWESNKHYIFCVCVFVALGIQHAMRMRHVVVCGLACCKIFLHLTS